MVIALDHYIISPEPFIEKCRSLSIARDPYLEVLDGRVRLAWTVSSAGDQDFMERSDVIGLGIWYDMLLIALSEAGGTLDAGGRYPINDAIRQRLVKLLSANKDRR